MRALAIASRLTDAQVTFLGSGLARFDTIIPKEIRCIHLPEDVPGPEDRFASRMEVGFLHYVPINVEKVARRAALISETLHALFPVILVVDVSAEVTLLATLCGIPTVVVRQNGDRDDMPHLHAYESAQLLVAPSSEQLMSPSPYDWVNDKTFFSGGFSKYSGRDCFKNEIEPGAIGIMAGSGGTSLNGTVVSALAEQCPDRCVHVIGNIPGTKHIPAANVIFHGQLDDPVTVLSKCEIVVGNAGHNTVMEMADLRKKFICIPEERPFQEQLRKAALLEKNKMAVVVHPPNLENVAWGKIIGQADNLSENCWDGVIANTALEDISKRLHALWDKNFHQRSV